MVPEASNAANFGDFSLETLANGLFFSGDFGGDGGRVAGADSSIGLLGIGGGVVGEMLDKGALVAPMFRLICISKSPTYDNIGQIRAWCHVQGHQAKTRQKLHNRSKIKVIRYNVVKKKKKKQSWQILIIKFGLQK